MCIWPCVQPRVNPKLFSCWQQIHPDNLAVCQRRIYPKGANQPICPMGADVTFGAACVVFHFRPPTFEHATALAARVCAGVVQGRIKDACEGRSAPRGPHRSNSKRHATLFESRSGQPRPGDWAGCNSQVAAWIAME